MSHEEYIRSNRPLRVSAILVTVALVLPISILCSEGWHSGVGYAFGVALAAGIIVPGIYLFRPLAFYLWGAFSVFASVGAILAFEHYWRSVPDWMSAQIPHTITVSVAVLLWFIQASMFILGVWGWMRYFRNRNAQRPNA